MYRSRQRFVSGGSLFAAIVAIAAGALATLDAAPSLGQAAAAPPTVPPAKQPQQPTPEPVAEQPMYVQVIRLDHGSAESVAKVLVALFGDQPSLRVAADGERRLVVFATSEKHDMLGAVVRELEKEAAMEDAREAEKHAREADENAAARKVKIFSLQHLKADEAAQAVAAIVTGPTVAVDRRTNSIIASGLNGELDVLEALLQRLDQPPPSAPPAKSYEVELFALMERPADGPTFKTEAALEDRGKLKPDASLEKTVEELKRQGFGQVWQASRANVLVRLGGTFKAENAGLLVHSNVSGVLSEAAGGLLQLKITVQQERREAVEPKYAAPPRPVSAQLSTEITANLNHDIVLGTVGVNVYGLQIRRVAYVIRVTEATPSQESEKPME